MRNFLIVIILAFSLLGELFSEQILNPYLYRRFGMPPYSCEICQSDTYLQFFQQYQTYVKENPTCDCYDLTKSQAACKISDKLFSKTDTRYLKFEKIILQDFKVERNTFYPFFGLSGDCDHQTNIGEDPSCEDEDYADDFPVIFESEDEDDDFDPPERDFYDCRGEDNYNHETFFKYSLKDRTCNEWRESGFSELSLSLEFLQFMMFRYTHFYSNYRQVFLDLCTYGEKYFSTHSPYRVGERLTKGISASYRFIDEVRTDFLPLYTSCLAKHPHPKIYYERGMVYMHQGDTDAALADLEKVIDYAEKQGFEEFSTSELYLQEGSYYAELGMYDKAVEELTKAIHKDPKNKEAYFERAVAYFEKGDFDLALADYLASGKRPSPTDTNFSVEYASGLVDGIKSGISEGCGESLPVLIPMMSVGLWATANVPYVPGKFVGAAITCISVAGIYLTADQMVGELRELVTNWDKLSEKERGQLSGYILGKYGTEIFTAAGSAKLTKAYHELKRANQALTFEIALADKEHLASLKKKYKTIEKAKKDTAYIQKAFGRRPYSEEEIRDNLKKMGYSVPERPKGIPDNFITKYSDKNCGIVYQDPANPNYENIRIMPGTPHSPNPSQQHAYIIHMRNGKALNSEGNPGLKDDPRVHIPPEKYIYRPSK